MINPGFIESLQGRLQPEMYGVGNLHIVNQQGYDRPDDGTVRYLHPACMLVNLDVARLWP